MGTRAIVIPIVNWPIAAWTVFANRVRWARRNAQPAYISRTTPSRSGSAGSSLVERTAGTMIVVNSVAEARYVALSTQNASGTDAPSVTTNTPASG